MSKIHASARLPKQPLHSLVVHFPIALLGMSFVFDVLSLWLGPTMSEAARYNLLGGLAAALIAGATGARDLRHLRGPARRIGRYHAGLNLLMFALFSSSLLLRWHAPGAAMTSPGAFFLSALGVVVMGISGYLGGVMVFNHGVGVELRPPAS